MIILLFVLITISLLIFSLARRQRETVWLVGIFIGFILINAGVMLYYAKMGGLSGDEQRLFFLFPQIQSFLQNMIITLNNISLMVSLGQNIFLYFVLIFSFEIIGVLRKHWVPALFLVWPVVNVVISRADFLIGQNRSMQDIVIASGFFCTVLYLLISVVCLLREYFSHTIRWIKRCLRYIILSIINLIVYYFIFCQISPVYIISNYYPPMARFFFPLQYRLRFSMTTWALTLAVVVGVFIAGCVSLYKYTRVTMDENKENIYLERQIDTASMGMRVFIHGFKNQLLAERIVLNRLEELLAREKPDIESVSKQVSELAQINGQVTLHIESLYKSFKRKNLTMTPYRTSEIVQPMVDSYQAKYPNIEFTIEYETDATFMADKGYVTDALANLLQNAVDAVAAKQAHGGKIHVMTRADSRWCAIRVDDNGIGMDRDKLKKIFKPFFTDKKTGANWGIGLSSVRQTVKFLFGQVYVESRKGEGSTFVMAFPRVYEKKPSAVKNLPLNFLSFLKIKPK